MTASTCSSHNGAIQPPFWKPPVGSSLGPPGACITPSSEVKAAPTILRIGVFSGDRGLDPRDIDLAHRHHRVEHPPSDRRVGIAVAFQQHARRDLPGKAPAIAAPAALALRAAAVDDGVPVAIGFGLVL